MRNETDKRLKSHVEGGQGPWGSDKWSSGLTSGPKPQAAE